MTRPSSSSRARLSLDSATLRMGGVGTFFAVGGHFSLWVTFTLLPTTDSMRLPSIFLDAIFIWNASTSFADAEDLAEYRLWRRP